MITKSMVKEITMVRKKKSQTLMILKYLFS